MRYPVGTQLPSTFVKARVSFWNTEIQNSSDLNENIDHLGILLRYRFQFSRLSQDPRLFSDRLLGEIRVVI